jgi:probable rRNA maturation factor
MRINIFTTSGKKRAESGEIRRLIRRALANEKKSFENVNVILSDNAYLRRLNKKYFNKKKTTNVISFNLGQVAEVYVSEERARDMYELYYYILHGLLHVIGYDHTCKSKEALMNKKCQEYLSNAESVY